MNITTRKCDACRAMMDPEDPDVTKWVRLFGVSPGVTGQPVQPTSWIDFCPSCADKTTVAQAPTVVLNKRKAASAAPAK